MIPKGRGGKKITTNRTQVSPITHLICRLCVFFSNNLSSYEIIFANMLESKSPFSLIPHTNEVIFSHSYKQCKENSENGRFPKKKKKPFLSRWMESSFNLLQFTFSSRIFPPHLPHPAPQSWQRSPKQWDGLLREPASYPSN